MLLAGFTPTAVMLAERLTAIAHAATGAST
jgi:hypothetical protein